MDKRVPPVGEEKNKQDKGPLGKGPNWTGILVFAVIWIFILYGVGMLSPTGNSDIPYSTFKKQLRLDKVAEVTIEGNKINGLFTQPVALDGGPQEEGQEGTDGEKGDGNTEGEETGIKRFQTVLPSFGDEELMNLLEAKDVVVRAEVQEDSWLGTLLIYLLPWVLIIGFFIYSSKKLQERIGGGAGGKGPFGFGKSKAKLYAKETIHLSFDDVAP